jgi:hypothetical protein
MKKCSVFSVKSITFVTPFRRDGKKFFSKKNKVKVN